MTYSLSGSVPASAKAAASTGAVTPGRRGRRPKDFKTPPAKTAVNMSVDSSLERLAFRLAPIDRVERKIARLRQLAGDLPVSVASVLTAILDHLSRVAAR